MAKKSRTNEWVFCIERAKIATWDVRGLGNKEVELNKTLKQSKIDISVITHANKKLKGTVEFEECIMIYSIVLQNGRAYWRVTILVNNKRKSRIISYNYVN